MKLFFRFFLPGVLLLACSGCLWLESDPPEGNLVDNTPKTTLTVVELKNWIITRLAAESLMQPEEDFCIYPAAPVKWRPFLAGAVSAASRTSGKITLSMEKRRMYVLVLQEQGANQVQVSFHKGKELLWKSLFRISGK